MEKIKEYFLNFIKKKIEKFKSDREELTKIWKDDNRLFKLNRLLSNDLVVNFLIVLVDLILFFAFNFLINSVRGFRESIRLDKGISGFISIFNIFPSIGFIIRSGKLLYLLFFIVLKLINAVLRHQIKLSYSEKEFNVAQKGDSRWETLEGIKNQYQEIDERDTEYDGMPGFPVACYGDKVYIDTNMTNTYVIGITRSGKGEMLVFRTIDTYSRSRMRPSIIINDMKGELYKSCQKSQILQQRGYDTYFLNLQNPLDSMGYNPLDVIVDAWINGEYMFAEDMTKTLTFQIFEPDKANGTEKFFSETGAELTAALILAHVEDAVRKQNKTNELRKKNYSGMTKVFSQLSEVEKSAIKEKLKEADWDELQEARLGAYPDDWEYKDDNSYVKMIHMYSILLTYFELSVVKLLDANGNPTGLTRLDEFFLSRPIRDRARVQYMATAIAGSKTKSSVYSTMNSKLSLYTLESIAKMSAESSFKLKDVGFGEKPIAVFLGIPDEDKSKHQIAVNFIKQLYAVLAKECWDGGVCKRPVKFIVDEAGNLPEITELSSYVTVCAGRNITFDFYIQSYKQFEEVYGKAASTIRANCGNKVFIRTDDTETTREFSELVGNETVVNLQRNGKQFELGKSFMENVEDKPLITPLQLTRLQKGECVVVRTMKVEDNNGERVYMAPILNSVENGQNFKFRYEYIEDQFPTPKYLSLREVMEETGFKGCEHINLDERIWSTDISFDLIDEDKKVQMVKNKRLRDIPNELWRNQVTQFFEIYVPEEVKSIYPETKNISVEDAKIILNGIKNENNKDKIKSIFAILDICFGGH